MEHFVADVVALFDLLKVHAQSALKKIAKVAPKARRNEAMSLAAAGSGGDRFSIDSLEELLAALSRATRYSQTVLAPRLVM